MTVAGVIARFERRGVDERLERRAGLPLRLHRAVEVAVVEVAAADHRAHVAGVRDRSRRAPPAAASAARGAGVLRLLPRRAARLPAARRSRSPSADRRPPLRRPSASACRSSRRRAARPDRRAASRSGRPARCRTCSLKYCPCGSSSRSVSCSTGFAGARRLPGRRDRSRRCRASPAARRCGARSRARMLTVGA